jgi:CheY-like chemotaxis protein
VEADSGQIHQVIVNLAANARDAMPDGGKLVIETANRREETGADSQPGAQSGKYVSLTVRDTGHGMDAATMECAFEPFFTTKGLGKGTGLGLATVYGIVRQSGGYVSIQSELGRGATFLVHLPAVELAAVAASPEPVPTSSPAGGETVLLVEDEDGVRRLVAAILEQHGYRVLEAAGGEEAIRTFEGCPDRIDLLITDVVMPRMKGPELVAHLQAQHPEVKVLYISGYSDPSNAQQVSLGTGSHYLQKPFGTDALARAVRGALGTR